MREMPVSALTRIKTPLRVVRSCLENARVSPFEADLYFDIIGECVADIGRFVNDYAMPERDLNMRSCSVMSAVRSACEKMPAPSVNVSGDDATVIMDFDVIEEAVLNIFEEARARSGGKIVAATAETRGAWWTLCVPCLGAWSRRIDTAADCASAHGGRLALFGGRCEFSLPVTAPL